MQSLISYHESFMDESDCMGAKSGAMMHFRFLKKFYLVVSLLCISMICMAGPAPVPPLPTPLPPDIAMIQKRGVLRVAFFHLNMPPFFMRDAKGNWSGIDIDLANMIAQQLNVKLQILTANDYDSIVNMVYTGQADMGMGLLGMTPERELKISFTTPYYSFHRHMLVNRLLSAQYHWNSWDVVNQMETANKPIKVGALGDGAIIKNIPEIFPNAIPVPYNDLNVAMQDVVAGKIFAVINASPVEAQDFLNNNPRAPIMAEDVEIPNRQDLISIALPWQYFSLRIWLNAYIAYLQSNNIENQLFSKYLPTSTVEINHAPEFY